ncbi:pyridoxine 5'-phosphate synthase [Chromatiales bacterium (ex Bugula neritina AB1)]|nr:pyridoxine 5'-phosphate synthase [Chromatiales bacterium (ex Bugula neritina AB1)]
MKPILLGVNVDHVATIRQARGAGYPDPVHAALQAELAGADGITMHLREDRRHIQDSDVERFAACTQTKLNFEMAATTEMRAIAMRIRPLDVCIVPEKREELTTEGGLDVASNANAITELCHEFADEQIRVSLFVDPDARQIDACASAGAPFIELHTGSYAEARLPAEQAAELAKISEAARYADSLGIVVNAGHGLTRYNVAAIAAIPEVHELNIGHSLIADAMYCGLPEAVRQMRALMIEARQAGRFGHTQ